MAVISRAVSAVLILFVRAYQVVLSPHIGNCCRFEPSCSVYCIEALRTHGVLKGCRLAFCRLIRCRPFGPSGYDPVPSSEKEKGRQARRAARSRSDGRSLSSPDDEGPIPNVEITVK